LVDEYERKGYLENVAHLKAHVLEHSPSSLQKRTEKSTVRVFAVDASDEERLHLQKDYLIAINVFENRFFVHFLGLVYLNNLRLYNFRETVFAITKRQWKTLLYLNYFCIYQ